MHDWLWLHERLRASGVQWVHGQALLEDRTNRPVVRRLLLLSQLAQVVQDRSGEPTRLLQGWHEYRGDDFRLGSALDVGPVASGPDALERVQLAACELWRSDTRLFGLGLLADRLRLEVARPGRTVRRYWGPHVPLLFRSPVDHDHVIARG